jgi:phospholipid/cholesterol/gamma-HCH transport system permease protein
MFSFAQQIFIEVPTRLIFRIGQAVMIYFDALKWVPQGRIRWQASFEQSARVGVESIPMVVILAVIGGGVLSLQLCHNLGSSGGDAYVGALVALATVREIAPIFTALALTARNGTAIASELAHMNISDQVDAMKVLQVCPSRYLVLPRVLACLLMTPLLSVIAATTAIISGMVVAKMDVDMHYSFFMTSVYNYLKPEDLGQMMVKGLVFGLLLGMVSVQYGMTAKGGSQDVGLAAMKTAVWVSVTVLLADLGLTWIFRTLSAASVL